ncbi:hypothetical protein FM104_02460 [Microbacterium esteraromaticum]|uniref:Uncharacterized protein n=1 Tax=Microbacterium esteraromaticum TaxID=57043 RepID=A0A1R4IJA3_9MICO|nr:hypothetical protein FM104_02460 [Microbacterium esteraromaticum]
MIYAVVPVPSGNRVEITQVRARQADAEASAAWASDAGEIVAVRDLNRGIGYQLRDVPRDQVDTWRAQVRDCSVVDTACGPRTTLTVMAVDARQSAADALSEADAAALAAKAESDRWGGTDRPQTPPPKRFW